MKSKNSDSRNQRVQPGIKLSLADETEPVAFNPYDRKPQAQRKAEPPTRTDLRKLSEWIKLKRDVDALKKGEDET